MAQRYQRAPHIERRCKIGILGGAARFSGSLPHFLCPSRGSLIGFAHRVAVAPEELLILVCWGVRESPWGCRGSMVCGSSHYRDLPGDRPDKASKFSSDGNANLVQMQVAGTEAPVALCETQLSAPGGLQLCSGRNPSVKQGIRL